MSHFAFQGLCPFQKSHLYFSEYSTDPAALDVLQVHDELPLLGVDPAGIVDRSIRVGQGDDLAPELRDLLDRVLRHVPGTGDGHGLALEVHLLGLQHLLAEIGASVTGGLWPYQGAAPVDALSGQDRFESVGELLVLSEEVADLPSAYPDVTGRNVGVRADVAVQFVHEALAEPHDLGVALSLRVEIRPSLGASHRQAGEGVLEHLLETEELQDAQVDGGVQAQTALVRTDSVVELDPVSTVDLHGALVVCPGDPEHDLAIWLDDPVEDLRFQVFRALLEYWLQGFQDLAHGLVEFLLPWVLDYTLSIKSLVSIY